MMLIEVEKLKYKTLDQIAFTITSDRIFELSKKISEIKEEILKAHNISFKKNMERKILWLQDLKRTNEIIHEKLSKMECNLLH